MINRGSPFNQCNFLSLQTIRHACVGMEGQIKHKPAAIWTNDVCAEVTEKTDTQKHKKKILKGDKITNRQTTESSKKPQHVVLANWNSFTVDSLLSLGNPSLYSGWGEVGGAHSSIVKQMRAELHEHAAPPLTTPPPHPNRKLSSPQSCMCTALPLNNKHVHAHSLHVIKQTD